jgi:beta-glucuronidase
MLYPIDSETREVRELNGLWDFVLDPDNRGLAEGWAQRAAWPEPVAAMPVPASYNDISVSPAVRDHVGPVWYRRTFFAPASWAGREVRVRVGAASHRGTVWINGREVVAHKGGFLPFEGEAGAALRYGAEGRNTIVVRVDNILDWTTLPPGEVTRGTGANGEADGPRQQEYFHDFFNYSGIHRPVRLVVTPRGGIRDITVCCAIDHGDATVQVRTDCPAPQVSVTLVNADGVPVASGQGSEAALAVTAPRLWYPGKPYLYELRVEAREADGTLRDCYHLPVGLRTVRVAGDQFLVNDRPFHFRGFGKHEDSDIRGKGHDDVVNQRDFNLLKWINANSFRTSHYPYAEEILRMADREGIAVIGECPAVGIYIHQEQDNPTTKLFVGDKAGAEKPCVHPDVEPRE